MKKKLIKMLTFLNDGEGLDLAEDTFLIGACDGSDKIYGFTNRGGDLLVVTRGCSDGYPVKDMDKEDLDYMFKGSSISKKIEKKEYEIVDADDI